MCAKSGLDIVSISKVTLSLSNVTCELDDLISTIQQLIKVAVR